jgi:hypothetical protein
MVVVSRVSSGKLTSEIPVGDTGEDHSVNPDDDVRPARIPADAGGRSVTRAADGGGPEQGGSPQRRQLSFPTSGLMIDLEITGSGESRRLAGRLIPGQPALVEIRSAVSVEADARGRFSVDPVPPGQVSLRCRLGSESDQARIVTGWVSL